MNGRVTHGVASTDVCMKTGESERADGEVEAPDAQSRQTDENRDHGGDQPRKREEEYERARSRRGARRCLPRRQRGRTVRAKPDHPSRSAP